MHLSLQGAWYRTWLPQQCSLMPWSVSCTPELKRLFDPICESELGFSASSALRVLSQSVLGLAQEWMPEQKLKGIELVTSDCPHVYLARLISVVCTLSWIGPDVLYLARFLILVPLDRCTVPTLVSNLLVCNSGYTMPRLHCYSLQDWCI